MKTCKSYERAGKELHSRTAGLDETLDSLLRRHEGKARQYAYSLAGNSDEAMELVQQAGYKVLRHWKGYDPVRSFQSWYLTIVKNLFKDARRRSASVRMVSLDTVVGQDENLTLAEVLPDGEAGLLEDLERRETIKAARRSLLTLKEGSRAVLTLCDIEGMGYEDAARKLGLPTGTVRSRLSRARAAIRRNAALAQII